MQQYISIKEAADLLGVTPQTLRAWEKKGELVPYRNPINNYRVYKISQIEKFFEEMRNHRSRTGRFRLKVKVVTEEEKKLYIDLLRHHKGKKSTKN